MLPTAAREVLALCQTATVDAARLSEVLHRDQALAGHVLRMANSPLYAPGVPIVSLQQAISRLGLNTLSEIAVSAAVHSRVFTADATPALQETLVRQWRHSLAAGLFAKEIARTRRRNVESAFLCGLLHDAGKPVVATALSQRAGELRSELTGSVLEAAMDVYHTELGEALATQWELPTPVRESARYHHDHSSAPTAREAAMTAHLADHLAHFVLPVGDQRVEEAALRAMDVLEELNLYPDDVDGLLALSTTIRDHVKVLGR